MPNRSVEYILKDSESIIVKTDLNGNITYVNQDFVNISGYSQAELIGSPQSIIRHSDMPPEPFADLMRTLKRGKAWTGLLKNRCKNGDYYWVEVNAAPILENQQIVGYTSIRIKPSREKVLAAERTCQQMKAGNKQYEMLDGEAVQRSLFRRVNLLKNCSIRAKTSMASGVLALLFVAIMILTGSSADKPFLDWTMALSIAGFVLAALFGFLQCRDIEGRLTCVRRDIECMCSGDLSGKIESSGNDELAGMIQALRILQTNVKLLVGQIKESTDTVNRGAHEIAAGNADLSARTESQASSLEQTAASMEELAVTVKQNVASAEEASQLVQVSSSVAVKGGQAVDHVVEIMASIRECSRKIADITGVIDGIAFQTNILALNAAVEAARAGEEGKGFAVVASEVRNLAQRSAAAAREIKSLIDDSVEKVDAGSARVDEAGKTMAEIIASVAQVADIMHGITRAGKEQAISIDQVNQAIVQIDGVTQQNAALVEQAAAAADDMQQQVVKLSGLVGNFKLISGTRIA